jgi:hypothetical protein
MGRSEMDIIKAAHGADVKKGLDIYSSDVKKSKDNIFAWLRGTGIV